MLDHFSWTAIIQSDHNIAYTVTTRLSWRAELRPNWIQSTIYTILFVSSWTVGNMGSCKKRMTSRQNDAHSYSCLVLDILIDKLPFLREIWCSWCIIWYIPFKQFVVLFLLFQWDSIYINVLILIDLCNSFTCIIQAGFINIL